MIEREREWWKERDGGKSWREREKEKARERDRTDENE